MTDTEQPEGEPQSRHVAYCGGMFFPPRFSPLEEKVLT